jgi:hypothetical protein
VLDQANRHAAIENPRQSCQTVAGDGDQIYILFISQYDDLFDERTIHDE